MRRLSENAVQVEAGEIIPVICDCGWVYTPAEGSEFSVCPLCGEENDHSGVDTVFTPIPEEEKKEEKKRYQPNWFWSWFYNNVWRFCGDMCWHIKNCGPKRNVVFRWVYGFIFAMTTDRRPVKPLRFWDELLG